MLIDREGLGHTPDSVSSLPSSTTRMLDEVDTIVLVDNAQQPMQAAPVAAIRQIAAAGYGDKLVLCFTHFEMVHGPNLPDTDARRHHVIASVDQVLTAIGNELGYPTERLLRQRLDRNLYLLSRLQHRPRRRRRRRHAVRAALAARTAAGGGRAARSRRLPARLLGRQADDGDRGRHRLVPSLLGAAPRRRLRPRRSGRPTGRRSRRCASATPAAPTTSTSRCGRPATCWPPSPTRCAASPPSRSRGAPRQPDEDVEQQNYDALTRG